MSRLGSSTILIALVIALVPSLPREGFAQMEVGPQEDPGVRLSAPSPPVPPRPLKAPPERDPPTAARLKTLIENLRSAFPAVRDGAESELAACGSHAIPALREAAGGARPDVAERARRILDRILADLVALLDATGEPIAGGAIELADGRGTTIEVTSDALGFVVVAIGEGIPGAGLGTGTETGTGMSLQALQALEATVSHPEYGRAPATFQERDGARGWRVALVRQGSAAAERALSGRVTDPDGEPVAAAVVTCSDVRTAGEGLIDAGPANRVLTGEDGRFRIYTAGANRREERGALIPPGSRFRIRVEAPEEPAPEAPGLFPHAGEHPNAEVAEIRLERPERFTRLRFEDPASGYLSTPEALRQVSVTYRKTASATALHLGSRPAVDGGARLAPGLYRATLRRADLGETEYLPVELAADGPEELVFRLPPPVIYHGRVVDGATGAPLAGALVAGWMGSGRDNLALLGDDGWDALEDPEGLPSLDDPALRVLREHYSILALGRTDAEGRFQIVQGSGTKLYGLLAFARDRVPWKGRLHGVSVGPDGRGAAGDLPLFAAAKVLVQPLSPGKGISVSPRWIVPSEDGQPAWLDRLLAAERRSDGEPGYVHWLRLDEVQPVFVPAGVRLRLRLEAPYHDEYAPATIPEWIRLEAGGKLDLGPVAFEQSLPATVEVVDARGKPVEGIPVRSRQEDDGAWCVAHVTDAGGLARFHVHPRSRGEFGVIDIPRESGERIPQNLRVPFEAGEGSGSEPISHRIVIEDRQVEAILGAW